MMKFLTTIAGSALLAAGLAFGAVGTASAVTIAPGAVSGAAPATTAPAAEQVQYKSDGRWQRGDRRWDRGDRRWDRGDRRWNRHDDRRWRPQARTGIYFHFGVPGPRYIAPKPRRHHRAGLSGAHIRWCENRYRSYRAWDNTYQPYNGARRQCWSPYS